MPVAHHPDSITAAAEESALPSAAPATPPPASSFAARVWTSICPLSLICGIGLSVRLHALGAASLSMDEGVSATITRLSWSEFRELLLWREGNMSLYYILLRMWAKFGSSEFTLRAFSALLGTLTILAIYFLGRELYGRSSGLLAALLLALHSFHVHYSQEARSYALLGLLLVLAAYFLVRAMRTGSEAHSIAFVLFSALSVYAHFLGVFCVLAFLCSALLFPECRVGPWRVAELLAVFGLLAFPGMQYAWQHRAIGLIDWIPSPSWSELARCASALLGTQGMLGLAYAAILFLLLAFGSKFGESGAASWLAVLPSFWAFLPGLAMLLVSLQKPILFYRYLVMCIPGVVLLVCYAAYRLRNQWRLAGVAALVLISALSLQRSFEFYAADASDWRGAIDYTVQHAQPDDVVLLDNRILNPLFDYYRRRTNAWAPRVNSFGPRSDDLTYLDFAGITPPEVVGRVAKLHDRVWIFQWSLDNPLIPELQRYFHQDLTRSFSHIQVSLYSRTSSSATP